MRQHECNLVPHRNQRLAVAQDCMHRRSLLAPADAAGNLAKLSLPAPAAAGNLAELPFPAPAAAGNFAELYLPAFWPSASVSLSFWQLLVQLPVPPLPAAAD